MITYYWYLKINSQFVGKTAPQFTNSKKYIDQHGGSDSFLQIKYPCF